MKTKKTKTIIVLISIAWTLLALFLYISNQKTITKETYRNIKLQAQSYYSEILLLNQWNLDHKGAFIFSNKDSVNQCKHKQIQGIITDSVDVLNIDNYCMINQLSHLSYSKNGLIFKIIEKNPKYTFNEATDWEIKMLNSLKRSTDDTLQAFYNSKGELEYYTYIAPFKKNGNKIISGISISIDVQKILKGIYDLKKQLQYIYLLVYFIGIFTIILLGYFIIKYQNKMHNEKQELINSKKQLSDLNNNIKKNLESLKKTNEKLNNEIVFRKRIESELIDNEKNLKMIFEKANDAILILDKEEIIDCNSKTLELFDCSKNEITGLNPLKISPEYQHDGTLSTKKINESLLKTAQGENISIEWTHCKLGGEEFEAQVSLSFLKNYFGKDVILAVIRDISNEKEYKENLEVLNVQLEERQEELAQQNEEIQAQNEEIKRQKKIAEYEAEKALEASKYKSIFLASMSHEIRTPLNGIISMVDILNKTNITDEQREYLEIVQISGNNLLSIINDILDYSKIEANQLELENISINLYEEITDVVKMLSFKTEKKGLKLTTSIAPNVDKYIKGDPVRIKQVLINYCNNAIKFTENGFVSISVKKLSETDKYTEIKFSVQDTGIGISRKNIKKLFQEFQQANSDTTRKFGGTGLGLAISKKIAQLFNGNVGVNSVEGEGSTFWFTGKFKKTEAATTPSLKTNNLDNINIKKLNILLAEDNPINQKVAQININKIGHNLTIANDGKEAVHMYIKGNYDVILMDIQMPILDGYGATKKIREFEASKNKKPVVIIALTANALKGEKEKCFNNGMNDYLSKPFKYEELYEILKKQLSS